MRRHLFALLLVGGSLLLAASQGPPDTFIQQVIRQLTRFYTSTYPEKTYIQFDKDTYAVGEIMWFKAYVVEANAHRPDTLSRVLYVDLISPDQKVVQQRMLELKNGTAPGDFQLSDTLTKIGKRSGCFNFAYCTWALDFFLHIIQHQVTLA